jgi:hypothetical protein
MPGGPAHWFHGQVADYDIDLNNATRDLESLRHQRDVSLARQADANPTTRLGRHMAKKPMKASDVDGISAEAIAAAAKATTQVDFTCSSSACIVTLQVGLNKATFVKAGHMTLPSGQHTMTWQVRGPVGTPFTLTASGATMTPVKGNAVAAGLRTLTVP